MRVVVVGAGVSGLVAARELQRAGVEVTSWTRAARRAAGSPPAESATATLDHGAQFFTVRTPAFQHRVDDWVARGLVTVWCHGFDADDGYPRYVATAGMNSLAKDLARRSRRVLLDHGIRRQTDATRGRWSSTTGRNVTPTGSS